MRALQKLIPSFLKPLIRFVYYPQERKKVFRERGIKRMQDQTIQKFDSSTNKLVIFLVAGADYDTGTDKISGGIISIVSLCEESAKLKSIHGAEVVLCTFPGQHLLQKFTQFRNETNVLRYDQLEKYFAKVKEVILQLPEYMCNHFVNLRDAGEFCWLHSQPAGQHHARSGSSLQVNIRIRW